MRGLVLVGPGSVEFRADLPEPSIEDPGDAVVAVRAAGICGSDLHPYSGREPVAWGIIPGHEAAGEVVEVGASVHGFRAGDRVCLPFTTNCGDCAACRSGLSSRCERGQLFGWSAPEDGPGGGLQGTQAEFVRVPLAGATLIALSSERSYAEGVLIGDNFATGFYCAVRGEVGPGSRVVVIGCGAVGLSAIVAARHLGAERIVAVDPVRGRRQAARRLGADESVVPEEAGDVRGDSVLEAVGSQPARQLAVAVAAAGAVISSVGVAAEAFGFTPADLYDRNLSWRTGRCPARSLQPTLLGALEAGLVIPVDELAPGPPRPLEEGPDAYREFASRTGSGLKPLLAP